MQEHCARIHEVTLPDGACGTTMMTSQIAPKQAEKSIGGDGRGREEGDDDEGGVQ